MPFVKAEQVLKHEVLVIGGGLAGMRATLEAARTGRDVAIISKVYPTRSHSVAAQGGINAAFGEDDSPENHAYDTVKGSDYLGDQEAIETLCNEAPDDILELEHMGVAFSRKEDGRLAQRPFGGAGAVRTCFVADITGHAILHTIWEQLAKSGITSYEEWFVTSLIVEDGRCKGAVALQMTTGTLHTVQAGSIILATGGLGRVFEPSTNALICTGDGMALAYRAGAALMDMEFSQFHPTTLYPSGILITEGARGEGGHLLNAQGERFMSRYAPQRIELASRDVVSRSERIEIDEGRGVNGCVLLDLRHLGSEVILTRLGQIYELALNLAGTDLLTQPVQVRPGMHYQMGGIKTDVDGRSTLPGLYAAGECACVSVHGANRLGGNSLLETVVFGRRAGKTAAEEAQVSSEVSPTFADSELVRLAEKVERPRDGIRAASVRYELGNTMRESAGIFRDADGLGKASETVGVLKERYSGVSVHDKGRVFNTDLIAVLELGNLLDLAETMVAAAVVREESRGSHSRRDFPNRDDDNWLKHTMILRTPDGPELNYSPVTITKWQPTERTY